MMMDDQSAQSGYYQEIARAFLERRGGALVLSPKDQAAIAVWEEKRIPLKVVLEGVGRTFDSLKSRGRDTRSLSLAFCDREVEAAFAQHRDRAAGRRKTLETAPRLAQKEVARQEIAKALAALPAGEPEVRRLLVAALEALAAPQPDETALEEIDAGIDEALWAAAADAEKARAAAEARKALKGRSPSGLEDTVKRLVVKAARTRRRLPPASLHYY
jgi:hypothetical protein